MLLETTIEKSPAQLTYEIEKTQHELTTLRRNWEKKKVTTSATLQQYRVDIKELDAVLAATELGYKAYCRLVEPLGQLALTEKALLTSTLSTLETQFPAFATCIRDIIQEAHKRGTEAARVIGAREAHKTTTAYLRKKSKDLYTNMKLEKKGVEEYAGQLENSLAQQNRLLHLHAKVNGFGL